MSKKNILKVEHVGDNKTHVTFETYDGIRKYEYVGSSSRAVRRGRTDLSELNGRLIEHKKS